MTGEFCELFRSAKGGNEPAVVELLTRYDPVLTKAAIVNSVFDEDLYQELRMPLLDCVRIFSI